MIHICVTDFLRPLGLQKETTITFTDRQLISKQTKVGLSTHILPFFKLHIQPYF